MLSVNGITTSHHSELTKTMGRKETNMMTEDKMKIVVCNTPLYLGDGIIT